MYMYLSTYPIEKHDRTKKNENEVKKVKILNSKKQRKEKIGNIKERKKKKKMSFTLGSTPVYIGYSP